MIQITEYLKHARDLDTIVSMAFDAFGSLVGQKDRAEFERRLHRTLQNSSAQLCVAYDADRVVGYTWSTALARGDKAEFERAAEEEGDPIVLDDDAAEVKLIDVHPAYQRRRIGSRLLSQAIEQGRSYGYAQLVARCVGGDDGASARLFSQLGFERIATIDPYFKDGNACAVMALRTRGAPSPYAFGAAAPYRVSG